MGATAPNWLPALAVLVAALVAAVVFLWRTSLRPSAPTIDPDPERLQRRVERLMEQLRELEVDKHLVSPEEHARQREELETIAAAALRERDTHVFAPPAGPLEPQTKLPTGFFARHPQLQGALWGGGIVLFFVALGLLLVRDNTPRNEGPVTDQVPPMSATPSSDTELDALRDHLDANPDDIVAAARAAHLLLRRQDLEAANDLTERSLILDPFHTETRIHAALLRAARGDSARAEKELVHLADTYPHAHEALLYLGMLRLARDDKPAALEALERFAREAPPNEQPPVVASTLANLRRQVSGAAP